MDSLSFKISDAYEGLAETEGIARLEGTTLILEFRTRDVVIGVLKSEMRELSIPIEDLASATYEKGLFGAKVRLRSRRLQAFDDIPGAKGGEVRLAVARALREEAEQFALAVQLRITQQGIRRLDERLFGE